ncbi:MAG: ABC transporter ATP-binding protein, partial [Ilumatobacteraceae bacterium]
HLDNEGEVLVQNALDVAMKDRTSLVIAHRLSTIRDADRIVVLDNGTIIEQGTHEQLMNNNSLYAAQVRAGETFEP